MKKYLLLFGLLISFAATMLAQCTASFTWSQTQPNTIDFVNTSIPQNQGFTYTNWSFGDATSSNYITTNPSHFYNVPGTYLVTISVLDSLTSCVDTFADSITVTGTVACTLNATISVISNETCNGCADGVLSISATGGTAPYVYLWNNLSTNMTATGLTAGSYSACVLDVNGCTACDTVTVITLPPNACQAAYNVTPQPGNVYDFTNTSTASPAALYFWTFGDGQVSSLPSPSHSYIYSGNYEVCLSFWDSVYSCNDYVCDTLYNVVGTGPATCTASFYPFFDPIIPNLIWMVNNSTASSQGTVYIWDWGDNTPVDSMPLASHTYAQSGLYTICLYLIDYNTGCRDTFCLPVNVVRMSQQAASTTYTVNVTFQQPTGIQQAETASESWSLYPVPVSDMLAIRSDFSVSGKSCRILDLAGRTAYSGVLNASQLDVSALESGVYFFQLVEANGQVSTQRFIKN
ncbi:MAG: PKD domain-containing protein [Bacteroidia bacterium]